MMLVDSYWSYSLEIDQELFKTKPMEFFKYYITFFLNNVERSFSRVKEGNILTKGFKS